MKVTTFGKAGVGIAATLALSLGVSTAAFAVGPTAAAEDPNLSGNAAAPATQLVGVGSDTTQDVVYGLSQSIPAIQSWTATGGLTGGSTTLTYRSGLNIARPNGSGAGYKALTDSIGLTAAGNAKAGDVDFARASGKQGVAASGTTGITTDIPFAIDAMSVAVPAGSPFLLTNSGAGLTIQNIVDIYAGTVNEVNTSTGALQAETTPGTADAGFEAIQAFLPKPGSGSRQFFLGQLSTQNANGIPLGSNKGDSFGSTSAPAAGAPYVGSKTPAGADVQEHDATVLTSSFPTPVAAIAPFSGAKFIGYHNGKIADPDTGKVAGTDYKLVPFKSTVTGAPATGVLPYVDNSGTYAPNTNYAAFAKKGTELNSFSLTRSVYNIIPTAAWKNPTANAKYTLLNKTFVGPNSDVCLATSTITAYGFLTAPNCGDTSLTFDATPSTATVSISNSPAVAGGSTTVTVSVQSNGNGGGTAALTIGGATYNVTIPAGATSGSTSVPTPNAGTLAVSGGFTPNLAGVAPTQISGSISVAAAAAPAPSITSVKITGKAKVGKVVKAAVVTSPAGQAVTYQWFANGKKIKGATKASLKLTNKLKVKGKKLTVKVTLGSSSKTSAAVKVK